MSKSGLDDLPGGKHQTYPDQHPSTPYPIPAISSTSQHWTNIVDAAGK
jgi:hypothetical protein